MSTEIKMKQGFVRGVSWKSNGYDNLVRDGDTENNLFTEGGTLSTVATPNWLRRGWLFTGPDFIY